MVRQSIIFPVFGYTFPMKNNFIRCGICGWCLELLWTGFLSFRRREWKLTGHSSLWMFPIYGMAAFLKPLSNFLCSKKCSFLLRGFLYMLFIFTAEYMSGSLLKKTSLLPVGLFRDTFSDKRCDSSGLCTALVLLRSAF